MSALKVDGFLKPFRGRGDDWDAFWNKFLVLATIQGWDTDDKQMKNFPLFLDADAFLVYSRMTADDKKDKSAVVAKMKSSFCVTKSQAYRLFVARKLREDESADAYVADLQRLATLAGHDATDDKDPMLVIYLLFIIINAGGTVDCRASSGIRS